MAKTIEQLRRLQNNPFYQLSKEEEMALSQDNQNEVKRVSSKKKVRTNKEGATVKETGKFTKHATDPVSE